MSLACGGEPSGIIIWAPMACWCCELHVWPGSRSLFPVWYWHCGLGSWSAILPVVVSCPLSFPQLFHHPPIGSLYLPHTALSGAVILECPLGGAPSPETSRAELLPHGHAYRSRCCVLCMRGHGVVVRATLPGRVRWCGSSAHLIGTCI